MIGMGAREWGAREWGESDGVRGVSYLAPVVSDA